jgi:hypothetical protein
MRVAVTLAGLGNGGSGDGERGGARDEQKMFHNVLNVRSGQLNVR